MRVKRGVSLKVLQPQMVLASQIVEPILNRYGQEGVITSGCEGVHSKNSKHYIGYALDFRHRDMDSEMTKRRAAKEMQEALGAEYYVMYEDSHIHVQYNGSTA
mgnify:CR=1 FL=1